MLGTLLWKERVSSERTFSINSNANNVWEDPQESMDQLSCRSFPKQPHTNYLGWKNILQVLPTATIITAMELCRGWCRGRREKGTQSMLPGSSQGLPRTNTKLPENFILLEIWMIWWQNAQPAHFSRTLLSKPEQLMTVGNVLALVSITKANPVFSSWLHLVFVMGIFLSLFRAGISKLLLQRSESQYF